MGSSEFFICIQGKRGKLNKPQARNAWREAKRLRVSFVLEYNL